MALWDRATEKLFALLGRKPPAPAGLPADLDRDPLDEIGWGGVKVTGGIVNEEHNAELTGVRGVQTAVKMRREDAQIRAVEKVISLPIRSTTWFIEEPDGAGAAEKEACELLRTNLFGGMVGSWDRLIAEGCQAIYYGARTPEIVWEERAGLFAIKKVASRNPELIERWLYDEVGQAVGYLYAGNRPKGQGLADTYGGIAEHKRIPIPLEKTLHFVYDQENENPAGFGLWRSQYGPWYIKRAMLKVMAIGVERNLLDVPVGKVQKGAQAGDITKLKTILSRWRAAQDAAVVLTEDQSIEFMGSQRAIYDAMPFLYYQNQQIALVGLSQFLNLGMQSAGTQSLATEHVRIFETAVEANADWEGSTIQEQLIDRWTLLNFGPKVRSPRLMHKPIRARDIGAWTTALNTLAGGGFLHATVDDEERIRDAMDLPAIPLEQLKKLEAERQKAKEFDAQRQRERIVVPPEKVKATDPCGHTFAEGEDVETLRAGRDEQEADFHRRATELIEGIQSEYLTKLRPLVEEAQDAGKIAQGKPIDRLPDVAVPGSRRYTDFVRGFLWEVLNQGRQALADETGDAAAAERPVSNRMRQWITARAELIAHDHLAQLKTAVLGRVLSGIRAEMTPEMIFSDAGAAAIAEFDRNIRSGWNEAAAEVLAELADAV